MPRPVTGKPESLTCFRRPDIARARKLLGREPKAVIEGGLRQTIEFFRGKS
jgi:nucleoside-diphosphate-sugar epimerase